MSFERVQKYCDNVYLELVAELLWVPPTRLTAQSYTWKLNQQVLIDKNRPATRLASLVVSLEVL